MILEPNEKDFGPEVFVERMLRFDNREIIAGRNNTSVENNQVILPRGEKDDLLLTPSRGTD
jgi:hypothetical protein